MAFNLWRTTKQYKELEILMEESYSDDPEQLEVALNNLLEGYEPVIESNAEELAEYIKNLQSIAKAQKERAKELSELAKVNEKKADRIMKDLEYALNTLGIGAVQAGVHTFRFKKGSTVVEADVNKIPQDYIRVKTTMEPDKKSLGEALKKGVAIEGARLVKNPDKLELK